MATNLDANQAIKRSFDDATDSLKVLGVGGGLVPDHYTKLVLGYSAGDLVSVEYYDGATLICTINLTYFAGDLTQVERV